MEGGGERSCLQGWEFLNRAFENELGRRSRAFIHGAKSSLVKLGNVPVPALEGLSKKQLCVLFRRGRSQWK